MFPTPFHFYPTSVVEKCDLVTYIGGAYRENLDLEFNFESKIFFRGEYKVLEFFVLGLSTRPITNKIK